MHKSGKNRNNKYSLHNTSNRNGQHLIDFMIENRLTCLNTNFQKRQGKLWTHTYANKSKAQIDYLFINRKWKNSAMNCEAYSTFEGVFSDHRIVTAKIHLSLRKNATPIPQRENGTNPTSIRPTKRNHSSNNDPLQKHKSESTFTRWRHGILRHCCRSTTRRHASPISLYHLSRLRA